MSKKIAIVCFFEIYPINNGASEVIISLFNCIKNPKKIFYIKSINTNSILKFLNIISLNNLIHFYKIFSIFKILISLKKFFKKSKSATIIVEGASWIGFSFILIYFAKKIIKNLSIVYHSHNIEYDLRKQKGSNFLICKLTEFFERIVFKSSNYSTAVSKEDQRRIYELYKAKPLMLENGIDENRLKKIKKMEFPKQFIIFSGSYEYFSNKQAIDDLIWIIMPKILKKFPHLKLIITGKGLPSNIQSKEFVIYYSYLPKEKLIYLIQKSNFILLPFKKSPGTKLKIIEALMLGSLVICSNQSIKSIVHKNTLESPLIYRNNQELYNAIDKIMLSKINKSKILKFYTSHYAMQNIIFRFRNKYSINVF